MANIKINGSDVNKMYVGDTGLNKMCIGGVTVFTAVDWGDTPPTPALDYLCFTANTAGSTIGMTHFGTNQTTTKPVIYVSMDNENWTEWDYTDITLANVGDKVWMYGDNTNGVSSTNVNYSSFTMTGSVAASGDVTTLLDDEGVSDLTDKRYCFNRLFQNCTSLTAAPVLPATTLANFCYSMMFQGCTALTEVPALPATTLANYCYSYMFNGCTALTSAPALPATTMINSCYCSMFRDCTGLTTVPELPATTLALLCYESMFRGCTGLTTGVDLRHVTADALTSCNHMYNGCSNLTVAYTPNVSSWTTSRYSNWLSGVAANGTLYRPSGLSVPEDTSGCPSGWTQVDYPA